MPKNEVAQRKVWVSESLKGDIRRYWRMNPQYTSESDLLRTVIEEIAAAPLAEAQLADVDSNGKASVKVWVSPATWDMAATRAAAQGLSLASVIRRRLIRMMGPIDDSTP